MNFEDYRIVEPNFRFDLYVHFEHRQFSWCYHPYKSNFYVHDTLLKLGYPFDEDKKEVKKKEEEEVIEDELVEEPIINDNDVFFQQYWMVTMNV